MRTIILVATWACLAASDAAAAQMEYWEHRATIVAEAEDASALRSAEIIPRADASGGRAVRWQDESGRAEFAIRVFTPGIWHVWIRTAAKDHVNNGLFVELNGVRQHAPAGHPMAGTESVYLRKHPTNFSWMPEWQGPGEGNHAGPIAITIPRAGLHRLAIVARKIERPTLDKLVLTRGATAEFANDGAALGPIATTRQPLDGQLLVHPQNAARLARFRATDGGRLDEVMLCGLGSPEGFLFLPEPKQEDIVAELRRHGGNMIYAMAVRSHGGDGTPQENPFRNHHPAEGLDPGVMDRWERVLQRLNAADIAVFFLVYDDAALPFGGRKQDAIPPAEAEFFAAIVRRFAHLPNIVWGVAEEYADVLTPARAAGLATIIARENRPGLPLAIHHATGQTQFDFADRPWVNVFSQQPNGDSPHTLYAQVRAAVDESAGRWLVHMAENWNGRKGDHAACVIAGDREGVRLRNWATVMAGAAVCQVIGPWEVSGHNRPATPEMLRDMRTLSTFFDALPLSRLGPRDGIAGGDARWALTSADKSVTVLYASDGVTELITNDLPARRFTLRWLDANTGRPATSDLVHSGGELRLRRPPGIGRECAVAIIAHDITRGAASSN